MTRLQTGSTRLLVAGEFASLGFIGLFIIVLASVRFVGHSRGAFERGSALVIGGLLLLVGLTAAIRSLRLRVLINEEGAAVVGVTGVRRMKLGDVTYIGYGRSSLGRLLFMVAQDGRCLLAWGVSHTPGHLTVEASTAMETLRTAVSRAHSMPATDPLPELPEVPIDLTAHPPDGATLDSPSLSLMRMTLPGQLFA